MVEVGFEIKQKWRVTKYRKCLQREGLPAQPVPKQQPKKLLFYSGPHEGCSDIQQLVNTLPWALKQSMVVSSKTKVSAMYHQREVIDHQLDQLVTTWKN